MSFIQPGSNSKPRLLLRVFITMPSQPAAFWIRKPRTTEAPAALPAVREYGCEFSHFCQDADLRQYFIGDHPYIMSAKVREMAIFADV